MKINNEKFDEYSPAGQALMIMLTKLEQEEFMDLIESCGDQFSVEVKINNIECDFLDVMRVFNEAFEDEIKERVKQEIKDKFSEVFNSLSEIQEKVIYSFNCLNP